ncbi:hypothetical protein QBC44DRAFT_82555 [Cladorrhinum sp. PSN332]|nr:hypothetical protein QBC44DRAFT_82555 [Cladorrhinum sp. PSN332]
MTAAHHIVLLCTSREFSTQGTAPDAPINFGPEKNGAAATPRYFNQSCHSTHLRTLSVDSGLGDDNYTIEPQSKYHHVSETVDHEYDDLKDENINEHWTTVSCAKNTTEPDNFELLLQTCLLDDAKPDLPTGASGHLRCLLHGAKPAADHTDCVNHGFQDFETLKQHMRDCHHRPDYCPRCGATFTETAEWSRHINARKCEIKPKQLVLVPGVAGDTMDRIMEWEPDCSLSDEKNWEQMRAMLNHLS